MGKEETFDIQMSVILCKEHKKFFEEEVKILTFLKCPVIHPAKLVKLLHDAERCTQCRWKTLFDGGKK